MSKTAYSVAEAAAEVGLGAPAIYEALRGGYLVGRRNGTKWLITQKCLDDWLESLPSEPPHAA
jgi:excisionase family DNA binding protein